MHLHTLRRAAVPVLLGLLLASCAKKEEASPAILNEVAADAAAPSVRSKAAGIAERAVAAPAPAQAVSAASTAQQLGSTAATYTDNERKFIRTANARFAVKDVYVAALGIEDTVASHGGFVVKNEVAAESVRVQRHPAGEGKLIELNEYKVNGTLIVRVPSDKTQEFLRAIVSHVVFLDQRNFSAHDAQFDLLRQQLNMLRNQQMQTDLGDAVDEGGRLRHKTETIAARNEAKLARDEALLSKRMFEDQVSFSTIHLTLYQPSRVLQSEQVDIDSVYRHARPGFFPRLGEAVRGGWEGLLEFLLGLAAAWPVVLLAGLAGFAAWRVRRHRKPAQ